MTSINDEQKALLASLGLPTSFDGLSDEALMAVEDALAEEMQLHGLNAAGDGLSTHGELCRLLIEAIPDVLEQCRTDW